MDDDLAEGDRRPVDEVHGQPGWNVRFFDLLPSHVCCWHGAAGTGGYTDWEMAQLYQGGRLSDTTFMRGGSVVDNPFG
jgi:hypothetical protein